MEKRTSKGWLKAIIIPVHKNGNIKHCKNYRGIILFNSGHKLYTNINKNKPYTYDKNKVDEEWNRFIQKR